LGIKESQPSKPPKTTSKKQPKTRLPYRIFTSLHGIDIYVGKQAADNEVLSLDPDQNIRDQNDW
jgi:predicted ribosome quality control (RQC) complex YloA/Tae2 family protein